MTPSKNERHNDNRRLDDLIRKALDAKPAKPDFNQWQADHPDAVKALQSHAQEASRTSTLRTITTKGKALMKNRITKFAAAAGIGIAVLAGVYHLTGSIDGSTIAWADVVKHINNARTVVYTVTNERMEKHKTSATFTVDSKWKYSVKEPYLRREERIWIASTQPTAQATASGPSRFVLMNRDTSLHFYPREKTVHRFVRTRPRVRMLASAIAEDLTRLKNIASDQTKTIGERMIKGIQTMGFEIPLPDDCKKGKIRVWVVRDTHILCLVEVQYEGDAGVICRHTIEGIQWNIPVSDDLFKAPNLEGWTIVEHESRPSALPLRDDVTLRLETIDNSVVLTEDDIEMIYPTATKTLRDGNTVAKQVWIYATSTKTGQEKLKAFTKQHTGEKMILDFNGQVRYETHISGEMSFFTIDITSLGKTLEQFENEYLTSQE